MSRGKLGFCFFAIFGAGLGAFVGIELSGIIERKLAGPLLHQFLESLQRHNFPKRNVNCFISGFDT